MKFYHLIITLFLLSLIGSAQEAQYLTGFTQKIKGQDLVYHSPHANVRKSLVVRSDDSASYIEWNAQAIPSGYPEEYAEYIMMIGIDVNPQDKHYFTFYINEKPYFVLANPENSHQNPVFKSFDDETQLRFEKLLVDKYGDLMGYLYLKVPTHRFSNGMPLKFKIKGEHAGSQSWFMVFQKSIVPECKPIEEQAVIRENGHEYQQFRLDIVHLDDPTTATIKAGKQISKVQLKKGYNISRFKIPMVIEEKHLSIEVTVNDKTLYEFSTKLKPVTPRTIYLIHHSHVDIGYTHVQEEVLEKQWQWLEMAVDLAKKTQKYPPEAHFKWNVEVMWAVDQYLQNKPEAKKKALLDAVRKGWIELDAFYGNNLMALCNSEELVRITESARKTAAMCGVKLKSAMISDVPGWTWGMIPVLAKSGVKYLSLGTNNGHRIGHTIREWGDQPFYWVSPSGNEKVLTWIHGKGYSLFHTGLGFENLNLDLAETKILEYMQQLYDDGFAYDIVPLRYNIGSDNGPPDKYLPRFVMNWNEKYITPKLVISTVSESFGKFEKRYGNTIPEISGDFTAYWEDGAISSAHETAINQRSAERLVQAEALYALLQPENYPQDEFRKCWTNVILFNEHTWGSWNSISEPEAPFTKHQWEVKRTFSKKAHSLSKELLNRAYSKRIDRDNTLSNIEVFNTSSWPRSDLVIMKDITIPDKHILVDGSGNNIAWQILSTGEIAFIAKNVPALGSRIYNIKSGKIKSSTELKVNRNSIENEYYKIFINEQTGSISSLIDRAAAREWIDTEAFSGLNDYWYVKGRDPANKLSNDPVNVHVKEKGPVLVSLIVESKAPGCDRLAREIRLIKGVHRIDIINTIGKQKIYDPEGVHFAFPFTIPDPIVRIDLAYGLYSIEKEQIAGCNKNFFTTERFIDISNNSFGVTVVSPDAPIFEVGDITSDPIVYGWNEHIMPSSLIFSYVMNNYWETNYLAAQDGITSFYYAIRPHQEFDAAVTEKFAMDVCQPLIGIPVKGNAEATTSLFSTSDEDVLITALKPSIDRQAYIIRLYNPGVEYAEISLFYQGKKLESGLFNSNLDEEPLKRVKGKIQLEPQEWITLRINFGDN